MSETKISNNKRIAKNTIFLYLRMFIVLVVSLYTSRVILNTLGVEDYGINNVVAGFVSLFGFLNATLSSSIQRFYNFEGTKNGSLGFQRVYITGMIIHIIIAVIMLLVLESFGLWYVNKIMVIPNERLAAANILFQTSVVSMLFILLQIPFIGAIMAKEHMNFYAIVSIADVVLKLIIVILLPFIPYDKLIIYGLLSLSINIINFFFYFGYSKRKFTEIKFEFKYHPSLFKSILGFSGWNLLGTFAFMLKGQGLNMLLNLFFGPVINAARGVAFQVNSAVSGFSQNITVAFRPQIVNSYADNDFANVRHLMYTESRICFMLIATLITPLIIDIDYILRIWLGSTVPELTNVFTALVLIDLLVCTLNTPCTQVVWATGKIRQYQIASSIVSLSLLPLCWGLLKTGLNASSVFVATIVISVINQIICLITACKVFNLNLKDYIKSVILPCVLFLIVIPIVPYLVHISLKMSLLRLILTIMCDVAIAIPLCYFLGVNKQERKTIKNIIVNKISPKRCQK